MTALDGITADLQDSCVPDAGIMRGRLIADLMQINFVVESRDLHIYTNGNFS